MIRIILSLTLFFSINSYGDQIKCEDLCEVQHYVRQKCGQECISDSLKSANFKSSCEDIGGSWTFTVSEVGAISGFQCEIKKIKNISKVNIFGSNESKCSRFSMGNTFQEIQIISKPAK
jgi:hypothetical protein